MSLTIGTSGWHYGHWAGTFYPPGMKSADYLRHYATRFDAVEINNTFYRLPSEAAVAAWREQTPPGFLFAVKASRYITHYSKLTRDSRTYALFFDRMAALGDKLGPILFQTPPGWAVNVERLEAFLAGLPAGIAAAFEFRHDSWFCPPVYAALERHGAAFVIWHLEGRLAPPRVTAPLVYVRLHGPEGKYGGSYADDDLSRWAERIAGWRAEGHAVQVYFDNDQKAYAVRDALRLKALAG